MDVWSGTERGRVMLALALLSMAGQGLLTLAGPSRGWTMRFGWSGRIETAPNPPSRPCPWPRRRAVMVRYDVIDATTVSSDPPAVWRALLDAGRGEVDWWEPYLRMRPAGDLPQGQVGALFEIAANVRGDLASRRTAHFTGQVREAEEPHRVVHDYVSGDFRGTGEWTFEPLQGGGTRLQMRWRADLHGLVPSILARFQDIGAIHSEVMQRGFERLEAYLRTQRTAGPAG
jgi:uncharacterized protein YndB with AHSA1/START domain